MKEISFTDLFFIGLICGMVTTLVVAALGVLNQKFKARITMPIVACVVTFLSVQINVSSIQDIQDFILKVILCMSFSVLFYTYTGKWFIDTFFNWLRDFIVNKLLPSAPSPIDKEKDVDNIQN